MYMSAIECGCMKKHGLSGLSGSGAAIGTAVGSAYGPAGAAIGGAIGGAFDGGGGGGGGGSVGAGMPGVSVATNVNTQVSPQISPSFVQQDHPVDSAVTTNAVSTPSQSLPPLPVTGAIPGIDATPNPYAYPPALSSQPPTIFGVNAEYLALGAGALLLMGILVKKRKQANKTA